MLSIRNLDGRLTAAPEAPSTTTLAQPDGLARHSVGDLNQRPLLLHAGTGPMLPQQRTDRHASRPRQCVLVRHIDRGNPAAYEHLAEIV
jgi:hypothetical protein